MGPVDAPGNTGYFFIAFVSIGMNESIVSFQIFLRICSAPPWLIYELADWLPEVFDGAVNSHIRIRCILPVRFIHDLYGHFIDVKVLLF